MSKSNQFANLISQNAPAKWAWRAGNGYRKGECKVVNENAQITALAKASKGSVEFRTACEANGITADMLRHYTGYVKPASKAVKPTVASETPNLAPKSTAKLDARDLAFAAMLVSQLGYKLVKK